jgi:uncharacterized protein
VSTVSGNGHLPERAGRPGSDGEHALQAQLGTEARADRFYDEQVLDHLNERMLEFVARQEWFFLATSDRHGECDNSFRAGPPGFLNALDPRTLVYPEYRGNGVHASLGNIAENPHAGLLLMDFDRARIGLHINGRARMVPDAELRASHPGLPLDPVPGRRAELWVRVEVVEAYIHCAKHIPLLAMAGMHAAQDWGTDDYKRKGGDFFGSARDAQTRAAAPTPTPAPAMPSAQAEPVGQLAGSPPQGVPEAWQAPRPLPRPSVPPPPADVEAWRAEARRALEEAERRGPAGGTGSNWFRRP